MEIVSSECIILRNQDYAERDRLVTFYTPGAGRMRGIVKGSRKLTSRGVGSFEPFSRGVIHYMPKPSGGLVTIRKCDPLPPYLVLEGDYNKFLHAGYFSELIDLVPLESGEAEPFYILLSETLEALCEPGPARRQPLLRLRFELHYLRLLGYHPDWRRCCVCGCELFQHPGAEVRQPAVVVKSGNHQFDIGRGGVRCPDCPGREGAPLILSPQSLQFVENWANRREDSLAPRPTRRMLEELEKVITRHLIHHLGRKPRSLDLLPSLDDLED